MHWNEVWTSKALGPSVARLALVPASWLYALGWRAYQATYQLGLKQPAEPHKPVICVGNLVVGGSGKTPTTLHVAQVLGSLGIPVALSVSGYGTKHSEAASLAPDGPLLANEWGDEAALLRDRLPDIPIIAGRRRVLAAEICHQHFPGHVLLMDDGFQHMPLRKHLSLLLDAKFPVNGFCLPAGPYREPRSGRQRADLVLDAATEPFRLSVQPTTFRTIEGAPQALESPFCVLCALARPDKLLDSLPVRPVMAKLLPDHDPMTAGNLLDDLPTQSKVLVTQKDWVKLRNRADLDRCQWIIADYSVSIEPAQEFRDWLRRKLNELTGMASP